MEKLSSRLDEGLPGHQAHQKMLPTMADGTAINLKHKSPPRDGAVMILFFEEDGKVKFPLIQRPRYEGIHSGQMALPGGKAEPDDRDLLHTAVRETEEEIGVNSSKIEVFGELSSFYVVASNFQVLPVLGFIDHRPSFVPDHREVDQVVLAQTDRIISQEALKRKNVEAANGFKLNSPYFDVDGKVVWGATAMMLSEFEAILRDYPGR